MDSFAVGNVAVAARAYRRRGQPFVAAIVKATCALIPEKSMALLDPEPCVREERRVSKSPVASLAHASDLALGVPRPEVVVVGDACAPRGEAVARLEVGLEVVRGDRTLLQKTLEAIGERRGRRDAPPPDPQPFTRMPIVYERAYGGLSHRANPVGVGIEEHSDGTVSWPSFIVLPGGISALSIADPSLIAAGLGPISSIWPLRKQSRGSASQRDADHAEVFDWPADCDDSYFQAAQIDQQVTDLLPGDWIVVTGMHPHYARFRSALPELVGHALAETASGKQLPITLRIETVHVDVNAQRAEIVFRGSAPIDERDLAGLRVAGTVAKVGEPPAFGDLGAVVSRDAEGEAPPATLPLRPNATTQVLEAPQDRPSDRGHSSTLVMEPDPAPRRSTLEIETESAPRSLPFRGAQKPPSDAKAAPPPGSPWAAPASVAARPARADLTSTLVTEVDDADTVDLSAPPPPAGTPPVPPAAVPPAAVPPAAVPSAAVPPAAVPPPTARPVVAPPAASESPPAAAASETPASSAHVEPKKVAWRKEPERAPEAPARPAIPRGDLRGEIYKKLKR